MSNRFKYLSTFTGIGGFEIGIQRAIPDAECVGYSEVNEPAIKTYERHFEHENFGDITTIDPSILPDFDCIVGGFPCQAFSVAGKRRGFEEARGTLFFDVARILKDKRPRHLVLENVKGLLSHDGGKTIQTIARVLTDLGYRIEWQVLNSKDFGVPQNRERIYIVGHLRGECTGQIFPIFGDDRKGTGGQEREISGTIDTGYAKNHRQSGATYIIKRNRGAIESTKDEALCLDSNYWKGLDNHGQRTGVMQIGQMYDNPHNSQAGRIYDAGGISPTLDVMAGGNRQPKVLVSKATGVAIRGRDNGAQVEARPDGLANTLRTAGGGSSKPMVQAQDARIRRLTPTECERLQGFPDGWTEGVSDTQRYKQCGNAVTTNVVEAVMKRVHDDCLLGVRAGVMHV
jgi:DNA (cytosine-5)-methyltransferase 1